MHLCEDLRIRHGHAWNEKRQAFTAAFGSDDLDASVPLLPDLGVIEADYPRFVSTVQAIERVLLREKHVMRYAAADDFGVPTTIPDLPVLVGRCLVVARSSRGGS
jgi:GH15 family glucan-1,4-alpha-glucosidase